MVAPEGSGSYGCLHGVGLGPGDPDLLTVKAVKTIKSSPVVAFFAKTGRRGHARTIVDTWLPRDCEQLPLEYPLTVEIPFGDAAYVSALSAFYAVSAETIADHLRAGRDVALLCEGDPLFYGSFIHIYLRLKDRFRIEICPGITGMSGCWTVAGAPITCGDDVLTVLPGTLCHEVLVARLCATDAAVVMKIGRNFAKVRDAVAAAGLIDRALYVERGTMADQKIMPLADKRDETAPYFSMIIVPGQGRRL
jgi:precorrin-2/cobalt-factor-2 C20-methyltransferase